MQAQFGSGFSLETVAPTACCGMIRQLPSYPGMNWLSALTTLPQPVPTVLFVFCAAACDQVGATWYTPSVHTWRLHSETLQPARPPQAPKPLRLPYMW